MISALPAEPGLIFWSHSLFTGAHSHCCTQKHEQGAGHRAGGGVGSALRVLGIPTGHAGRSLGGDLPVVHGRASCRSPEHRQ